MLIAVGVALVGWVALLMVTTTPLRALLATCAIIGAGAIFLFPTLGIYWIAALLIGHWPWGLMRYLGILTVLSALLYLLIARKRLFPRNPLLLLAALFMCFVLADRKSVV